MLAMISGTFPESLCSACRAGQTHSLRMHAKILLAIADSDIEQQTADIADAVQAQQAPRGTDPRPNQPKPAAPPTMPPNSDGESLDGDELESVLTRQIAAQTVSMLPKAAAPTRAVKRPQTVY